jgi:molybdenum cofactor cytidylyltransferase
VGVPALFERSFFAELLSLADEAGAKSIILRNRDSVAQFDFSKAEIDGKARSS